VIEAHQHQRQLPKSASSPALWQLQLQESAREEEQQQRTDRLDKQQQHRHPLFSPRHTAEGNAPFAASASSHKPLGRVSRIVVRAGAGDLEDAAQQQHEQASAERCLTWQQSLHRAVRRIGTSSWGRSAGASRVSFGGAVDSLGEPAGLPGQASKDSMAFRTSESSIAPWESLR
jgi:hypothetical protein